MSRYYEEMPENIHQMSDHEIESLAQNIWQKINTESKLIDRNAKLQLRQRAYAIWRAKYPHENDDDNDCHLEEIYSWFLSDFV